jgi:hypothetical protein
MSSPTNFYTQTLALLSVLSLSDTQTILIENNANGNPVYIGKNLDPLATETDPTWSIQMLTYDSNNFLTGVSVVTTGPGYRYSWSNRASLTYSLG